MSRAEYQNSNASATNTAVSNHYAVLGITSSADRDAIRAAYRRQAVLAHPDKGGSDQAFHAVAEAFEILSSSSRRAAYDVELATNDSTVAPKSRKERALKRLAAAVAALAREQRKVAIDSLHPMVSEALLDWMERCPGEAVPVVKQRGGCKEVQKQRKRQRDVSLASTMRRPAPSLREELALAAASSSASSTGIEGSATGETLAEESLVPKSVQGESGRPRHGGCRGVHKAGSKSQLYQASIFCLNLAITSQTVAQLEQALAFHSVLVLIRNDIAESLGSESQSMSVDEMHRRFDVSITTFCNACSISRFDLGLYFRPLVSAIAEVGRQIHGQSSADLREALVQRSELLAAKERGWPALRSLWIGMLQRSKTEAEAIDFVDSTRRAHEQQRRRTRRLAGNTEAGDMLARESRSELEMAAHAVEQALDTEIRQASASARARAKAEQQKEREQLRRWKMRRQWDNDPRRTTEELLKGPPSLILQQVKRIE